MTTPTALRPVPGYPGYFVSEDARVFSEMRSPAHPRELRQQKRDSGHLMVTLFSEGKRFLAHVHRLVALAFIGPQPDGKPVVRHLDGDESNNSPRNLAWGTKADNGSDAVRLGEMARGERCAAARLTEAQVRDIRARHAVGASAYALSRAFGVYDTTIQDIVNGKTWRHVA